MSSIRTLLTSRFPLRALRYEDSALTYGFAEMIRSFGIPALLEARAHVERDEVTVRPTAPGAKRLFGVVRPSSGGPLNVSARADVRPDGMVELSGDCSCRTGRHCEHVAAVLLSVLGDELLELDTWKASEPNARVDRETREVDSLQLPQYSLLYLLNREPGRRRLTVHPRIVRVLKDGRFGAAKRCVFTGGGAPSEVRGGRRWRTPARISWRTRSATGRSTASTPR